MPNDQEERKRLARVWSWLQARPRATWDWVKGLYAALWAAIGDVLFTLALGGLFYYLAHRYDDGSLVQELFEHLGTAFVVAAIAVVGYEWKSKSKELTKIVNALVQLMNAQAAPGAALCIQQMFDGDEECRVALRASLLNVLTASHKVAPDSVAHRDLAAGMISALLESASTNAAKFELNYFTINILQPAQLIDAMLATRMSSLTRSETYVVTSDFSSFQRGQLKLSLAAMRVCLEKGATVKRIFYCFQHDRALPGEELERIAREHWNLSLEFDGYQVRFAKLNHAHKLTQPPLEPPHEGIFTGSRGSVRFEIVEPDLHSVRFHSDNEPMRSATFDRLWNETTTLHSGKTDDAKTEFLKYLVALKREGVRHRGALR